MLGIVLACSLTGQAAFAETVVIVSVALLVLTLIGGHR